MFYTQVHLMWHGHRPNLPLSSLHAQSPPLTQTNTNCISVDREARIHAAPTICSLKCISCIGLYDIMSPCLHQYPSFVLHHWYLGKGLSILYKREFISLYSQPRQTLTKANQETWFPITARPYSQHMLSPTDWNGALIKVGWYYFTLALPSSPPLPFLPLDSPTPPPIHISLLSTRLLSCPFLSLLHFLSSLPEVAVC